MCVSMCICVCVCICVCRLLAHIRYFNSFGSILPEIAYTVITFITSYHFNTRFLRNIVVIMISMLCFFLYFLHLAVCSLCETIPNSTNHHWRMPILITELRDIPFILDRYAKKKWEMWCRKNFMDHFMCKTRSIFSFFSIIRYNFQIIHCSLLRLLYNIKKTRQTLENLSKIENATIFNCQRKHCLHEFQFVCYFTWCSGILYLVKKFKIWINLILFCQLRFHNQHRSSQMKYKY